MRNASGSGKKHIMIEMRVGVYLSTMGMLICLLLKELFAPEGIALVLVSLIQFVSAVACVVYLTTSKMTIKEK